MAGNDRRHALPPAKEAAPSSRPSSPPRTAPTSSDRHKQDSARATVLTDRWAGEQRGRGVCPVSDLDRQRGSSPPSDTTSPAGVVAGAHSRGGRVTVGPHTSAGSGGAAAGEPATAGCALAPGGCGAAARARRRSGERTVRAAHRLGVALRPRLPGHARGLAARGGAVRRCRAARRGPGSGRGRERSTVSPASRAVRRGAACRGPGEYRRGPVRDGGRGGRTVVPAVRLRRSARACHPCGAGAGTRDARGERAGPGGADRRRGRTGAVGAFAGPPAAATNRIAGAGRTRRCASPDRLGAARRAARTRDGGPLGGAENGGHPRRGPPVAPGFRRPGLLRPGGVRRVGRGGPGTVSVAARHDRRRRAGPGCRAVVDGGLGAGPRTAVARRTAPGRLPPRPGDVRCRRARRRWCGCRGHRSRRRRRSRRDGIRAAAHPGLGAGPLGRTGEPGPLRPDRRGRTPGLLEGRARPGGRTSAGSGRTPGNGVRTEAGALGRRGAGAENPAATRPGRHRPGHRRHRLPGHAGGTAPGHRTRRPASAARRPARTGRAGRPGSRPGAE